jgi:hypothetical protein
VRVSVPERWSDLEVESQVEVTGSLAAPDAPVFGGAFAQADGDVVARDSSQFEAGDVPRAWLPLFA